MSKYPLLLEQSGEQKLKEVLECIESRNLESALDILRQINTAEPKDLEYANAKLQTRALAQLLCKVLDYSLEELYLAFEGATTPFVSQYLYSVMVTAISARTVKS